MTPTQLPKTPLKFFFYYAKQNKRYLFAIFLLIAIAETLFKLSPYFFSKIIDLVTTYSGNKEHIWSEIWIFITLMLSCGLVGDIIHKTSFFIISVFEPSLKIRIKADVFNYVHHHSAGYLANQYSGQLGHRINQIAGNTTQIFWKFLFGFYDPLLKFLITTIILATVNIWFAAVFLFWICVFIVMMYLSSRKTQSYSAEVATAESKTNGHIIDSISNSSVVKSFTNLFFEKKELNKILKIEAEKSKIQIRVIELNKLLQTIISILLNLSSLILAVYLWSINRITAGDFVLVITLSSSMIFTMVELIYTILEYHKIIGTLEDSLQLVSDPIEIKDVQNAKTLKVTSGEISFENITFSYPRNRNVFKKLSIVIKAGEKVGLVGRSGSGKSTFIQLLQRFYDPQDGNIYIDQKDISKITQDSLRKNITVIPQDTTLFHRSIKENIAYGKTSASEKEIISAAKKSYAHEFIKNLPEEYNTFVGEKGVKLSGGQRQRIAIARAILKNSPILILDEATSALDSESERYIQMSLKTLMRKKTVIAIAHRLSTLREMDRILVFENGEIIEDGKPSELLKQAGKYAKLWKMQIK